MRFVHISFLQVGDVGKLLLPNGVFLVEDTQTYTGYTVHIGELQGDAKVCTSLHL